MRISDWSSDLCSSDLRSFILVTLALLDSQVLCLRALFDLGGDARLAAVMDAGARRFQRLLEIGDRGFLAATGILELAHAQREDFRTQLALLGLQVAIFLGVRRLLVSTSRRCWISERRSLRRERFSRVCLIRDSVSLRRSLYFEMPAASSSHCRNSSGLASIIRETMPCSMIAYWFLPPRPVPRNRSVTSRFRNLRLRSEEHT